LGSIWRENGQRGKKRILAGNFEQMDQKFEKKNVKSNNLGTVVKV
jgi:hypothetical protein